MDEAKQTSRQWTAEELATVISETVEQTTQDLEATVDKINIAVQLTLSFLTAFKGLLGSTRAVNEEPHVRAAWDLCMEYFEILPDAPEGTSQGDVVA